VNFACSSYIPNSSGNADLSEFCDPRLDSEIQRALAAEGNNSPDAGSLWAQADRTVTDDAPWVRRHAASRWSGRRAVLTNPKRNYMTRPRGETRSRRFASSWPI
jgi:hypothetical protein